MALEVETKSILSAEGSDSFSSCAIGNSGSKVLLKTQQNTHLYQTLINMWLKCNLWSFGNEAFKTDCQNSISFKLNKSI